jgi:predicted ArsR family transcriptional regulator
LSNRVLLEEMKAKRKDAIEQITKRIKENQNQRRLIITELKKKGAATINELESGTGLTAKDVLHHLIAMRKAGDISEVDEKDGAYLYVLRRAR